MKLTLNDVGDLRNTTTAQTTINNNNALIETALENTLSRDGTSPNNMESSLDMDSNRILNLPTPINESEPLRLQDLNDFIGGGTINAIPAGGTTGQSLVKNSNADYDVGYANRVSSVALALPADFSISGSPVTTSGTLTGSFVNSPTGTGGFVRATSATITTPSIASPALTGTPTAPTAAAGTNTTQVATTAHVFAERSNTKTLTNTTYDSAGTGNVMQVSGVTISRGQYPGTNTNNSATAGNIGEFMSQSRAIGAAQAFAASNTPVNVTASPLSLTAGDWDVSAVCYFFPANTTNMTVWQTSISQVSATVDANPGAFFSFGMSGVGGKAYNGNTVETLSVPPYRISLNATTNIYLVANSIYTVSTNACYGIITARRVR